MEIRLAKTAGFCFGVDRAGKLTYGLLEQGVRVATLPVTPEKLKAAMTAKAAGVPYGQEPWDLGCSLYERLAFLKARHAGKGKG